MHDKYLNLLETIVVAKIAATELIKMYNKAIYSLCLFPSLKLLVSRFSVSSTNAHISVYNSNQNPNYFWHINTS